MKRSIDTDPLWVLRVKILLVTKQVSNLVAFSIAVEMSYEKMNVGERVILQPVSEYFTLQLYWPMSFSLSCKLIPEFFLIWVLCNFIFFFLTASKDHSFVCLVQDLGKYLRAKGMRLGRSLVWVPKLSS